MAALPINHHCRFNGNIFIQTTKNHSLFGQIFKLKQSIPLGHTINKRLI